MNKVKYSQDVDVMLIELSQDNIAYAEEVDNVILHYSENDQVVLIEILDFRKSIPQDNLESLLQMSQPA